MDEPGEKMVNAVKTENQNCFYRKETPKKVDHSEYKCEEVRLRSFDSWATHYPVNPSRLAKSGFFSTGIEDEVICFSCGGHISNWKFGDIVQKKHKELFPACNFINNKSDNIPFHPLKANIDATNISNSLSGTHLTTDTKIERCHNKLGDSIGGNHHAKLLQTSDFSDENCLKNDFDTMVNNRIKPTISTNMPKPTLNFEGMVLEEERLKTFECGWPLPYMNKLELAKAGFFYLGYKDKVQCAFCHGIVSSWEANDIPIVEHSRHFPFCKFLQQCPFNKLEHLDFSDTKEGEDVCGTSGYSQQVQMEEDTYKLIDKSQQHTRLEELGVRIYSGPVHPQQATYHARMRSYTSWPENIPVKEEDLAAAGFFYVGIEDHTKCFHCDGGLCCWERGDDPWVEHARWFRNCSFVHLNKGGDFIQSCINRIQKVLHSDSDIKNSSQQIDISKYVINDGLMKKVDDCMKTSLINSIVKTGIYPMSLIKAAIVKQLQEHGCPFATVDDICEAISLIKEKTHAQLRENSKLLKGDEPVAQTFVCSINQKLSGDDTKQLPDKKGCEDSKLEEENNYLKDQRLCKVCMDHDVNVVFLPCGHLLTCTLCAPALKECPGCRKIIQATVRVYLP